MIGFMLFANYNYSQDNCKYKIDYDLFGVINPPMNCPDTISLNFMDLSGDLIIFSCKGKAKISLFDSSNKLRLRGYFSENDSLFEEILMIFDPDTGVSFDDTLKIHKPFFDTNWCFDKVHFK